MSILIPDILGLSFIKWVMVPNPAKFVGYNILRKLRWETITRNIAANKITVHLPFG